MPRARRDFGTGGVFHLYARGSNRQAIFSFDSDRADFLACLERALERHELRCLAYCLMPNHYHLLVEANGEGLSAAMKALNGRYALRFNLRHGRTAHLFKNRFGAVVQETREQFLWTLRYIVRNPVEAGLCAEPCEWPWSSYGPCAGLRSAPAFLHVDALLEHFAETPSSARDMYRRAMA